MKALELMEILAVAVENNPKADVSNLLDIGIENHILFKEVICISLKKGIYKRIYT